MNKIELLSRIQDIEAEVLYLSNALFTLKAIDITKQSDNFESLSTNVALRSERIACQLRNIVFATGVLKKSAYMKQVQKVHNIHLEYLNDILTLQLPGLLPKRPIHSNTAFLNDPIYFAFQEYLQTQPLPVFQECVICFTQVYNQTLDLHRIRDYDNLEFKQLLDTIAAFVLHDDSGIYCDVYHTTQLGNEDCTLIHIIDKQIFPGWIKTHMNTQI